MLSSTLPLNSNSIPKGKLTQEKLREKRERGRMSTTRTTSLRRPKWHPTPPPPPSPKIINLPRRTRRKQPKNAAVKQVEKNYKGKLENLFGEERLFSRAVPVVLLNSSERRDRVAEEECELQTSGGGGGGGFMEEKWRFQAEILRAECNFLRMERKFALKKLERNRARMERTLRSAVQTLASGRKKICEGKNVGMVLEEEIEDLEEKLEELQRSSAVKDFELRNCKNFDKKASRLQRRLEKLGGLSDGKSFEGNGEMTESSLSIKTVDENDKESSMSACKSQNKSADVEILRRKMEGLSIGMLDRMEAEYGSILSTTANSSVASSASTSKRIEFPDSSSFSTRQTNQESMCHEENKCSGRCKALVRKIVEQVRAETEQWSQMQEMLGQLRGEMEELQASRDLWENRALASETEIQSLQSSVQEWRQKATSFETKANELENEVSLLKGELENLRKEQKRYETTSNDSTSNLLGKQLEKEKHVLICRVKENLDTADHKGNKHETASGKLSIEQHKETKKTRESLPISLGKQLAIEKRILICRLKENQNRQTRDRGGSKHEVSSEGRRKAHVWDDAVTRSPLRDIANTSTVVRQISNAIFPLHSPDPSKP